MKKSKNIILLTIAVVLLTSIFLQPLLADTSISGMATCRVPHIITMKEVQEIIPEENSEKIVNNKGEGETISVEKKSYDIFQQEEVLSEETQEVELIKTVCAK